MKILVLDTIHGGAEIGRFLERLGHFVDLVDVYRETSVVDADTASCREYDLMIAPVHLDPSCFLLQKLRIPCISHHEAVRWILGDTVPSPMIEISGARGKTTVAHALAHVMTGEGILHTSRGTYACPTGNALWKSSITPASVIASARHAYGSGGWCIAEISLGFCGAGDLGILTSAEDYTFAGGKRNALQEKLRSGQRLPKLVTAPGVDAPGSPVKADEVSHVHGETCTYRLDGIHGSFSNPLLLLEGYRVPLMLAAAGAMVLGLDPEKLGDFPPLEGRMAVEKWGDLLVVDNSNSGTTRNTTVAAIEYVKVLRGKRPITLVIGQEEACVCEGFPAEEVFKTARVVRPDILILVGEYLGEMNTGELVTQMAADKPSQIHYCPTLEEGRNIAGEMSQTGSVILAVKTWR
ncbi:MAG TPA: coenzyme F430 synthase [Methanoregulaceae archaeon]|nr:coenzyme F430 synthase [Methanoregulaceae archaeon]